MKKHDLWGGLIWLLLGVSLCVGSTSAGLGTFRVPGTGFFPSIIGALMALFGLLLISASRTERKGNERDSRVAASIPQFGSLVLPGATLIVLLVYVALLDPLGFLLTTFLCLLILFKLSYPGKWLVPLLFSAAAVGLSYAVFVLWLRNPFPSGIFGF